MIIGLQGKKRSGKDTVASFFPEHWQRKSFASPLKQLMTDATGFNFFNEENREVLREFNIDYMYLADYLGLSDNQIIEAFFKEYPDAYSRRSHLVVKSSVRKLLQFVGTDIARNLCGEFFWVDKLDASSSNILITDVRFPNEVAKVKELGGVILTIERPGLVSTDTHASEQLPSKGDYTMYNDGTIEDLEEKVRYFLDFLA